MARLLCGTLTDSYSNMCAMHPTGTLVDLGDVNGYINSTSLLIIKIIICLSKNQKGYAKGIYLLLYHTAGFVCETLICANCVRCGGLPGLISQLRLYLRFNLVIAARVTVLCPVV